MSKIPHGEPYAGKLHVRFDEGADVPCGGVSPYSTPHRPNFIRPLALQASTIIGAKWLCLYALPETRLIEYYGELGFARLDKERETFVYSHVKPEYDQGCIFMYQSICNG